MAEEVDQEVRPTLLNAQYRQLIIATGIVLVLLTITSWAGSARTNRAKVDTFRSATSALAASLRQDLINASSQRSATGKTRLDSLVTEVAKAGGYRVVTLTNQAGTVLASTDKKIEGEKLDADNFPTGSPDIHKTSYGYSATAPIKIGDNVIGYLLINAEL